MDIYSLSRNFWDYAFENPEKIKPNHISVFFFAIEHCNRLGWKEKFGFPTTMVMDAIGVKSYTTYIKTLNELVEFGFIKMIEKSKNQYSSNIIAIPNNDKAVVKALDKAIIKHTSKQVESECESNDSIDIPIYKDTNLPYTLPPTAKPKTFKQLTEEEFKHSLIEFVEIFGKKTVRAFFEYWSEKDSKGKMKFQLNQTWDSKRRLTTWKGNEPKFGTAEPEKTKPQKTEVTYSGPFHN